MAYTLITGASSGIGAQTAIQLSSQYNLILCGRDKNRLNETLNKCNHPEKHLIWQYDLSRVSELEAELCTFIKTNGIEINQFVHCAGMNYVTSIKDFDYIHMQDVLNVNLLSMIELIKLMMRKKINNKKLTNIVMISSIAAIKGGTGNSLYAASKGAILSFNRSLAHELAPNVRVNTILPGTIMTNMSKDIYTPEQGTKLYNKYPLGEGSEHSVANMVEFLLSDKSRWITGQQFVVDGGYTA